MTTVPLGQGAYRRDAAGAPEIKLFNRFSETAPLNLKEQSTLLSRCGSKLVINCPPNEVGQNLRKTYAKTGLFNTDLFAVSGTNLYRYSATDGLIPIAGIIGLNGIPKFTWETGEGYQYLFVADGELLQVYAGGSKGTNTLTKSGAINTSDLIDIGGTYYGWNSSVDNNSPDGSAAHPWLAPPGTDPMTALANMLNFIGTPGVNFSTALRSANTEVTAAAAGGPPASTVTVTSISDLASANSIMTTVSGPSLSWATGTLTGAGTHALQGVYVPTGEPINALCTLSGYVLASVAGKAKIFFLNPGDTVIDTLNFFTKESNPDAVVDLLTVGDTFLAVGTGSIETWYATGDLNAPFAPIEGRTEARGIIDGTLVLVKDIPHLVGDDGIVYQYQQGQMTRVSNNGIEERIREQLRSEAGLT